MNCLDFRREKLADPRRLSADAQAHALTCAGCAAFAQSVGEDERDLERLLATAVPEGLADRILLRTAGGQRALRAWALAAGVLLALSLGIWGMHEPAQPADQYARLAIEHVVMEPESFTTVRNADPEALRAVVQKSGGALKELPGTIRYIRLCPLEDGFGWHIVFETEEGLATLILVPGKRLAAIQTASAAGWSSLARPMPRGYYAIVTASSEATARADRLIRARVDWDT